MGSSINRCRKPNVETYEKSTFDAGKHRRNTNSSSDNIKSTTQQNLPDIDRLDKKGLPQLLNQNQQ